MITAWALDLPAGKLHITSQVLLTMGAFKFELCHKGIEVDLG